uniref:Death domain-containing protein n=1 Tax=Amphimedon queenslandica TaxID=400682 RepID=A0A1X7TN08_AMPQE
MATKSRAKSSSPTPLTTNDYYDVLDRLKRCGFPQKRWYELGLRLGLHKDTLDAIERDYPGYASRCFSNCLSKWLSRKGATYGSLSDALKSMNENAAADKLDQESLAKKTLKAPPLKATKSRSFSLSGRPPPLSKMTRSLSLATEPMALETKPHQPPLTKQKSVELTLQKTPSRTQQPPSTALQPSLNNAQQSPPTPTLKPQQQEEKKDPLPSLPIEGSIEFITVKEMLADLVSLVDKFSESSQLKHIQSVINKEVPFLDSLTTKPIVIKLNGRWDKMTIKNFKSVLQYYFDPEIENLFSHISIKKGSVIITLLIPTSLSQSIIDTINNNRESMSRLGILEVAVDKKAFPIRKEDNNNFNASLLESVKAGDSFEVSMLLQLGADPNSKDERGKSAVEIANEEGHTQIKEEILAAGGGRRKSTAEIDEEEIEEKLSTERGQDYKWNEQKKDTVVPLKDPAFTKKMNKGYSIISIAQ